MLTSTDWIMFGIGFVLLLIWLTFFFSGLRHAALFDVLKEEDFRLKDLYFVGYAMLQLIGFRYQSKHCRKLRKELSVLYGEKYADYYLRVVYAQKLTLSSLVAVLAVPLYGLTNSLLIMGIVFAYAGVAYYYFGTMAEKRILKRSEEMLSDFSNVVSKLALLTNAGMIMREAWEEVAFTGETTLYQEMQIAVNEMKNGVSEIDALYNFGTRCIIPEIKKFTSLITQGIVKGNSELTTMLQEQSKEVWFNKRQLVKRAGEKAASKLLIPILIMFIGILIMIMVPIFTNMGI